MSVSSTRLNARQFLMLGKDPPGVRLELVHGEIAVSPSPSFDHSYVDTALRSLLFHHIRKHDLGLLVGDVDTILSDFEVRRPDIVFIAKSRIHLHNPEAHGIRFAPDLCVEILSPGSADYDQHDKFELYQERGVAHYWIVDPVNRTFAAYTLGPGGFIRVASARDQQVVTADPFPALQIPLGELWPPTLI